MKTYRYQVTVREIAASPDEDRINKQAINFEADSHDDLHEIVARAKQPGILDDKSATAFAVGLKLFGGVLHEHRGHPLFAEFTPHFGQLMKALKQKNHDRQ